MIKASDIPVEHHDTLESTNKRARQIVESGQTADSPLLVVADSQSAGVSEARGQSENVSYQLQQITRYREEFQPTGKLLMAVPDQIAMMQRMLATLPMGHVLTRCNDPEPK